MRILGIPVARLTSSDAMDRIAALLDDDRPSLVAYVNAHALDLAWDDPGYHEVLRGADLVLNDGIGVALAARMRGSRFPENLNGSDFNPRLLELAAERGARVFLLGAAGGIAERCAARLRQQAPSLQIVGTRDGYFGDAASDEIVGAVRRSRADVLLVAMGNPRQEEWLAEHLGATGCRLGVGVGAFFDFTVGAQRRAPGWMNKLGIEWVYRLIRDPARMWRRYVLGNPRFLLRAWRTRREERDPPG